ncbi:sigma factor, partial [Roseococcus thiosulfatophilus]|uniref:sigma factor n=1 Tax=Roseococcus thiosulfatophilus TaxID=35813 RepID=UPI0030F3A75C
MTFEQELLALLPRLRAYARNMARNAHDADDLVQDTVLRGLSARDRFVPGSNV